MAKINITSYEPEFRVRVKLQWRERFLPDQCNLLRDSYVDGLMHLSSTTGKTAVFTAPAHMQLRVFLQHGVDRKAFFHVLAQTINVLRWVNRQRLPLANLQLDVEHVFINHYTQELFFLYIPAQVDAPKSDLRSFLEQLVFNASAQMYAGADYKQELLRLLQSNSSITTHLLETFVRTGCPEAAAEITAGQQEVQQQISDSKSEYLRQMDRYRETGLGGAASLRETPSAPAAQFARAGTDLYYNRSDALMPDPYGQEDGTTLLGGAGENDGTVLLGDPAGNGGTVLLEDGGRNDGSVMIDTGGTIVLAQEMLAQPRLYRRKTGAVITIDKPVFRIGKEEGYVDYLIPDNPAISRSHADIISRGGSYYIYDNNSTNKTYVNNIMIPALKNVELEDGYLLRLADEEFEFRTTDS